MLKARCAKESIYPWKNDEKGRDKIRFTKIADFDCILEKLNICLPDGNPCGVAHKISCTDPRFYREPVIITPDNSGKSIAERFLDSILHDARELREMLMYKTPMLPLTEDEQVVSDAENLNYHICKQVIKPDEVKCRDHFQLSGRYRGPSHQVCNLNYQINPQKIQREI